MKDRWIAIAAMIALGLILCIAMANMHSLRPFAQCADGVFIGEAEGYRKHLKAQVTFSNGYITDVKVIEHYEKGPEHYAEPMAQIPEAIVAGQAVYVEAVAGATRTSMGIMNAVQAAVEQAKKAK